MTRNIETSVIIDAPVDQVWQLLAGFDMYHQWNPLVQFSGTPHQGATVKMTVRLFGIRIRLPVLIEIFEEKQQLRWRGGIPGLMTGSHYFDLRESADDAKVTRLIQGEEFNGVLVPLILPLMKSELNNLYAGINSALQSRMKLAQ